MADLNLKAGNNITLTKNGNDLEVNADVPEIKNTKSNRTTGAYSCKYIDDCNTYSTTEVNTGKTWIDSKPIYRKVITGTSPSAVNTDTVIGNIGASIDTIIKFDAFIDLQQYGIVPLPQALATTNHNNIFIADKSTGSISMYVENLVYRNNAVNITVEYTKTTD